MKIIAIADNKSGHKSQLYGVVNSFDNGKYGKIHMEHKNSPLNYLPFFLYKIIINIFTNTFKPKLELDDVNIIIAVGKRTLYNSLMIKNYIKEQHKKVFLIYLMPPTKDKTFINQIDLIFYHDYKKNNMYKNNNKFIPISLAPHLVNMDLLAKTKDNISQINLWENRGIGKIYGVLIGGDAKNIVFSIESAKEILRLMNDISLYYKNVGFLISTSRRTNYKVVNFLQAELEKTNLNYFFYNYHNQGSNPYLNILKYSSDFIISGESISMISECCSLENKHVFIFFNKSFYAKRYIGFHNKLFEKKFANLTDDIFKQNINQNKYNSTAFIYENIINLIN